MEQLRYPTPSSKTFRVLSAVALVAGLSAVAGKEKIQDHSNETRLPGAVITEQIGYIPEQIALPPMTKGRINK